MNKKKYEYMYIDQATQRFIKYFNIECVYSHQPLLFYLLFVWNCKPTPVIPDLNDCMVDLSPNLNDLTRIILQFRMHNYAVWTDMENPF